MIDVHQLLNGLVQAIKAPVFPDATAIATVLNLDISIAKITKTESGNLAITGARPDGGGEEIGVACGLAPRRELDLVFMKPKVPYRELENDTFGSNQHLQLSKLSEGFAVVFDIDGLNCGFTASGPDGFVQCLFCKTPETVD